VQVLESIKDLSRHKNSSKLHFGHRWLHILGVPVGFQDFATHFLDEILFQDVVHIDDLPFLGDTHVILGILSSCVVRRPSYFT
jgi:hypothetical protein